MVVLCGVLVMLAVDMTKISKRYIKKSEEMIIQCKSEFCGFLVATCMINVFSIAKIILSEVGFEPTPAYADQNAHSSYYVRARYTLSLAP